ncbi:hypothetical protein Emin_0683 [Elusimicrobium minutum Pei191]|uniref:DUF3592 domain-containing protein n=2 Tax=Elusimicrobium TaxID=423604 RepID=B2KCB1_ELUMP|nr:hypothetical protein Emin_0683 [Elusimicrobium minutum Pei191]
MLYSFINIFINQTLSSKPRAIGIAKDYVPHHKDNKFYSPVVTFEVEGKEYTFTDMGKYGFIDNTKNKKFTVLYNPQNPQEAEVKQPLFAYNFFVTLLFLVIVYSFAIFFDPDTNKQFSDILYKVIPRKNNDDILILTTALFYFASFGVFMFWFLNHKRKGKIKITAKISGSTNGDKSKKGTPLYIYKMKYSYNGKEYEFKDSMLSRTMPPVIENEVKILISPQNPHDAMVDDAWFTYLFPALFIIFPAILLLVHYLSESGFH